MAADRSGSCVWAFADEGLAADHVARYYAARRLVNGSHLTDCTIEGNSMDPRAHWESVYERRSPDEVSWYQREPRVSLALVRRAAPSLDDRILDVGGGASTLVDHLAASGYTALTVLDLAPTALARAQARLGIAAPRVAWLVADILEVALPDASVDVWHDRAVFHFLTRPEDQRRYIAQVQRFVRPGGHVIVATFAEDGPTQCSGLAVARYSSAQLHGTFGAGFTLLTSEREDHVTPSGAHQAFTYCACRLDGSPFARAAA